MSEHWDHLIGSTTIDADRDNRKVGQVYLQ